jgi:hypothetical protein
LLQLIACNVELQEKCTPESLREELGLVDENSTTDEAKPKSFIEKLMLGECNDVDSDSEDLAMLEEQRDLNAEIRIQIVNCMPGLITLLKDQNVSALKY